MPDLDYTFLAPWLAHPGQDLARAGQRGQELTMERQRVAMEQAASIQNQALRQLQINQLKQQAADAARKRMLMLQLGKLPVLNDPNATPQQKLSGMTQFMLQNNLFPSGSEAAAAIRGIEQPPKPQPQIPMVGAWSQLFGGQAPAAPSPSPPSPPSPPRTALPLPSSPPSAIPGYQPTPPPASLVSPSAVPEGFFYRDAKGNPVPIPDHVQRYWPPPGGQWERSDEFGNHFFWTGTKWKQTQAPSRKGRQGAELSDLDKEDLRDLNSDIRQLETVQSSDIKELQKNKEADLKLVPATMPDKRKQLEQEWNTKIRDAKADYASQIAAKRAQKHSIIQSAEGGPDAVEPPPPAEPPIEIKSIRIKASAPSPPVSMRPDDRQPYSDLSAAPAKPPPSPALAPPLAAPVQLAPPAPGVPAPPARSPLISSLEAAYVKSKPQSVLPTAEQLQADYAAQETAEKARKKTEEFEARTKKLAKAHDEILTEAKALYAKMDFANQNPGSASAYEFGQTGDQLQSMINQYPWLEAELLKWIKDRSSGQ